MAEKQSKADALRAMREANFLAKSSDGGVKEPPSSIPDYNWVKSPALVTAHGLSGKSCPLSRVAPGPSEAKPKRGRPRIGEVRPKPWLTCDPPMSERTWRRRQKESKT